MNIRDFQSKTEKELLDLVTELRTKLRSLRFDLKLAKLQGTHVIGQTKRDIARALTVLRQKHGTNQGKTE